MTARLQAAADAVDVLVIDLTTSNGRAPASLPAFNWEWPLTVTIVLVANGDQQTTLHAMERGSYVVLENSCSETELHAAITLATMRARQLRACATAGLRALRRSAYQLLDEEALFIELLVACLVRHGELSPAEARVTSCLLAGLTRDEIAAATNRSPQTIRTHSRAVLRKLGLELRRDLWPAAIRTIGSEWKVIAARVPGDIQEEPKASQPATRRKKRVSGFLLD